MTAGVPNKPRKKASRRNPKAKHRSPTEAHARLRELWQTPEFREKMKRRDEAFAADREANLEKYKRTGIPDGMTKKKAVRLWRKAERLADRFIQIMKDQGELPDDIVEVEVHDEEGNVTNTVSVAVPTNDAGKAERALREAFVLAVGPSTQQIKIQAINTVLNFTKSRPESKSKLTLNKAEDFLDEITKAADE